MLEKMFLQIINMSYIGSIVIVFILASRLLLKKTPKKYSYILWAVALIRLIVPISFESILSLIPVNTTPIPNDILYNTTPQINTGMPNIDQFISGSLPAGDVVASVNPMQVWIFIGSLIWILGIFILLIYGMVSLIKMKSKLKNANCEKDNIYQSDNVTTPFVLGLIQPKIYLPASLSEREKDYIVLHEQTHIKRLDHIIRFISYLVLCIHWFNPLVWIAFWLSGKDMEMSCDESVINQLGYSVKKDYSQSLLNLATGRKKFGLTPLAFGEGDTKGRIKNILNFKKPNFYFIIAVITVLFIVSISLLTNPIKNSSSPDFAGNNYRVQDILFDAPMYSFTYTIETAPSFSISSDYQFYSKESNSNDWKPIGPLYEVDLNKDELLSLIHFTELMDPKALSLLDGMKNVYRVDTNNENDVFYLVVETQNDQMLIFYGYATEEGESIRWIFETQRLDSLEISMSATELRKHRTEYVGNNTTVGNIVNNLEFPDYLEYKGLSLQTENQPYGITIIFKQKSETVNASFEETSKVLFEMDACILFALVRNVDQVAFSVDEGTTTTKPIIYTRDWAHEKIGVNLWEMSANEESFAELLVTIKEKVTYGSDATIDAHKMSEENLLNKAISDAIMDYHTQYWKEEGYAFESHINLAVDSNKNERIVTVYSMVLFNILDHSEMGLESISGSHIPSKLTFKVNDSGEYELVEYWIPRDGSYYGTDIREAFPDEIEMDAMNTQKYILLQKQSCYQQAVNALNINTNDVIENLLEKIMSSPKESSNPRDYIDAHRIEYRELTYYGDYTIAFIERSLETRATDLKSKILGLLYDEMTMQ